MKYIAVLFSLLFCTELIMGFTGTVVMIGGIAIRHVLFILAFAGLYAYFLVYLWVHKVKIFSLSKDAYFGSYTVIDWVAILFEVSMILSMTVIPMIKGTNMHYAHSEAFDSAAIFSLYFPVAYLIKRDEFRMEKLLNWLKYMVCALSMTHVAFYFAQDADVKFIYNFFEGINKFLGGNSIAPSITLGHGGYTRIIFTTSIYMIVGLYIFFYNLEKNKWYDYIIAGLNVLAVLTTVTKSIWFGIGAGFGLYFIMAVLTNYKNNKKYIIKLILSLIIGVAIIFVSDNMIFGHIITIRMSNAFVIENKDDDNDKEYISEKEKYMNDLDKEGAVQSNQIKLEQVKHLTKKWFQSPILGWGYGSYVEGYLRSETSPFSYEMVLFALLMKTGLLGLGIWCVFFAAQVIMQIKYKLKNCNHLLTWAFLAISMAVCVQTNPLLICFTGMSIVLLISLISVQNVYDGMNEAIGVHE